MDKVTEARNAWLEANTATTAAAVVWRSARTDETWNAYMDATKHQDALYAEYKAAKADA